MHVINNKKVRNEHLQPRHVLVIYSNMDKYGYMVTPILRLNLRAGKCKTSILAIPQVFVANELIVQLVNFSIGLITALWL